MNLTQRGIALISILLVVVLFSALAFQLYSHQTMTTAQTRIGLTANQARHSLMAGETLALDLLQRDWEDEVGRTRDDMVEGWAQPQPNIQTVSGELRVQVFDLAGRLNLNALAGEHSAVSTTAFTYLLNRVGITAELAPLWRDWIDADDIRSLVNGFQGREELDWLGSETPFRTPNRLAGHLSELHVLLPLDQTSYTELGHLITLLPSNKLKINVNTAHPEVLNSLLPERSSKMSTRGGVRNFGSVEAFVDLHGDFANVIEQLSVRSEFFEVRATLIGPELRMDLTSQIYRNEATGECQVVAREFGTRHVWST